MSTRRFVLLAALLAVCPTLLAADKPPKPDKVDKPVAETGPMKSETFSGLAGAGSGRR